MAKLRASTIEDAIFLFAGTAFRSRFREIRELEPDPGDEELLHERLCSGEPLDTAEVAGMPPGMQRILYRLLAQYVAYLHANPKLGFPLGFLDGTSYARLGKPLVTYLGMKWWPIPGREPFRN